MKQLLLIFFAVAICSANVQGQKADSTQKNTGEIKTIFKGKVKHGGYGGISFGYSLINNKDALSAGVQLAWIINHSFCIGFAGSGFVNDYKFYNNYSSNNLAGGYGGLLFETIFLPKFPVHISVPVLIGAGGISYNDNSYLSYNDDYYVKDADAYLIVEPGIQLELNLVKCIRLSLGATYRYTSSINLFNTPRQVLDGLTTGFTIKFGKF
ncbi:MAG: hypothetical protein PHD97_02515 [Bacteroidales bacterium]|nr:hypothetical protein [Bacteroidales bacterium]